MRISILTVHGEPYGLKLLNALRANAIVVDQVVVGRDVWASRLRWLRHLARRLGWPGAVAYLAWGMRARVFGGAGQGLERDYTKLALRVDDTPTPRSPETRAALERAGPDLCLLGDTGIVPPSVLAVPRIATLNAHPGVLPDYRGLDPALWALHEDRMDKIGCTLHLVDAGIDTGRVLEVRPYAWRGDETVDRLNRRLTEICVEMLVDACRQDWPAYRDRARPQSGGRLFSAMPLRGWFRVERKLARLARPPR